MGGASVELSFPVSAESWIGLVEPAVCGAVLLLPEAGVLGGRCGRCGGRCGTLGSLFREISSGPVSADGS